jgi:ACS family glucarate transporter-like MFS transporter
MTGRRGWDVRWMLVWWLFLLSAVSYLDRVNISIAGRPIMEEYHFSDIQLGKIFSAFLLGYALFQTPGGWLADKLGPRRVLTAGVLWWGIFTALTASVPQSIQGALFTLMAIRFFLGAGEAIIYPASNQFVARWIPIRERGIANGLIFSGVGIGAGITPPFITWLMIQHGWRISFWVCAAIGVFAGATWYVISRDRPEEHPRVSSDELAMIQSGLISSLVTKQGIQAESETRGWNLEARVSWGTILGSKEVWSVTFSYFCYGYVAWIFFYWFYIYLAKVRGLNLKASAFYAMLPFLAMAACSPIGGLINDRLTKMRSKRAGRCGVAALSMMLAAAFIAFGSHVATAEIASVVLAGGAGALYLSQSSFWSLTADISRGSSGVVSGFMNMGSQIGGMITATLTPWIASRSGWSASFIVAAIVCAAGALVWLLVDPENVLKPSGA